MDICFLNTAPYSDILPFSSFLSPEFTGEIDKKAYQGQGIGKFTA